MEQTKIIKSQRLILKKEIILAMILLNVTLEELAKLLDVSKSTIANYDKSGK